MKIVFIGDRERPGAGFALLESPRFYRPSPRAPSSRDRCLADRRRAYLLGSVSFAVVVSRAYGLPDPHEYGSGNPGATNVLRTGNKKAALLTLLGDGLKGFVAVFVAQWLRRASARPRGRSRPPPSRCSSATSSPVFHGFRGGKGVATGAGIVFALHWPLGLVLTSIWLLMAYGFKISSLAALTAAVLMPLGMFYVQGPTLTVVGDGADRASPLLAAQGEHPPAGAREGAGDRAVARQPGSIGRHESVAVEVEHPYPAARVV